MEMEKKKQNKVSCVWFGCYKKNHKTNRNKQCRYHTCSSKEEIELEVDKVMQDLYPDQYGKLILLLNIYFNV